MSDAEKAESKAVREYLQALSANAPRRGRKRTAESVNNRLAAIEASIGSASATKRLDLTQERMDLEAELEAMADRAKVDLSDLEVAFAEHAASYGGRRGISYSAWREVGVSAATLKKAGIRRSS